MKIELNKQKLPDDIEILKDISVKLGMELNERDRKILYLEEQINLLNMKIFGRKSEKWQNNDLMPDLFSKEDIECEPEKKEETKKVTIKEHQRKYTGRKGIDPNLPVDEIQVHDLSENEKKCVCCGKELNSIGYEPRKQVDIIPPKRHVIEHRIMKYGPCNCEKSALLEEPEIKAAKMPERIIKGSMLAEGALAYIMTNKFADGMPFYRQEKSLKRFGIFMTRQMMTDTAINISKACSKFSELLLETVASGMLINMDETPIKVVTEENKGINSKCFMWVMVGKTANNKSLVYFHYDPSRGGKIPNKLLTGFKGHLQTDGLKSYNASGGAEGVIHVGCNAHARREFDKAFKVNKYSKSAKIGLAFYRKIYRIEKERREELKAGKISESEFEEIRKNESLPVFEKFKKWMLKIQTEILPKSQVSKAIGYTLNEWDKLIRYLDKWYLTPDNNAAENAIRPFVIGRKNWLFAYSPKGAGANAMLYTLAESARINGLNIFYYFRYLFKKLPSAKTKADLLKLLPINLSNEELLNV